MPPLSERERSVATQTSVNESIRAAVCRSRGHIYNPLVDPCDLALCIQCGDVIRIERPAKLKLGNS